MLAVAALATVAAGAGIGWAIVAERDFEPRPAPALTLTSIAGERIELAQLRGRVVLLNFWATSCAICVREMPEIARMHARLGPRGLATVAIAMPYDRPDFVLHYARRNPLPFPIALDPVGEAARALGPVRGTPTLVVIDRAGAIVRRIEGEADLAALERFLERALGT